MGSNRILRPSEGETVTRGAPRRRSMMGERRVMQEALFYGFSLERRVRAITCCARPVCRLVRGSGAPGAQYSDVGRPSIDPELMIRMLIVGYGFGIRSERRLCEEVHLNLAYRWFCRLGLDADVPDQGTPSTSHSTSTRRCPRGGRARLCSPPAQPFQDDADLLFS